MRRMRVRGVLDGRRRRLTARTRIRVFLKAIEAFGAHQLFESVGELGRIVGIGRRRPAGVMVPGARHRRGRQLSQPGLNGRCRRTRQRRQ